MAAAQRLAAFCVHPQSQRPLSPRTRHLTAWTELPLGGVSAAGAVLLHRLDASGVVVVVLAALAAVMFAHGLFWIDLRSDAAGSRTAVGARSRR